MKKTGKWKDKNFPGRNKLKVNRTLFLYLNLTNRTDVEIRIQLPTVDSFFGGESISQSIDQIIEH